MLLDNLGAVTDWRSGETWSATKIRAQAAGLATEFARRGIGPGSRVVTWHGGDGRFFADLFAIWQAGACAVALNPNTTSTELQTIAEFVTPAAIIDRTSDRIPEAPSALAIASESIEPVSGAQLPGVGQLDDDALILFTSGTTGIPKGVVHTFRSLLARVALNQAHIPRNQRTRSLCVLPTHFGHGLIGNCFTGLLDGQDLVLAPASNLDVPANLGAIIDEYRINFMSSVPTLWKRVIREAPPPSGDTLRRVHVGSAPLSADLWIAIGEWAQTDQVFNMYGITETANWLAGIALSEHDAVDGLIGTMWGGTIAVRDAAGNIKTRGEGELMVQSPSLMKGYYRLPEKTEEVLRDGWLHTGDIGRIDEDGNALLTGRERYLINRGGLKVHPEDIDLLLERHEDVTEACAFAVPHDADGEAVGVALALRPGAEFDERATRRWCADNLSREKVPTRWFIVDEIPKTDRGKLNRDVVAEHCLESANGPT
jgi:acyl-CoA synthetase (AMP-forming)/AMP-acid ligase II